MNKEILTKKLRYAASIEGGCEEYKRMYVWQQLYEANIEGVDIVGVLLCSLQEKDLLEVARIIKGKPKDLGVVED